MGLEDVPRCQHVKVNGTQCGSPSLRRRRYCYFHNNVRRERARIAGKTSILLRPFDLPLLEDANSVQTALMKVMQMLGSGEMDHKTAGLMLYALQTASVNLRNVDFEVNEVTDIVIDRDTVHATCINGQQWFEDDFENDADTDEEDEPETAEEAEVVTAKAAENPAPTLKANADGNAQPALKPLTVEETRKEVQGIARAWLLERIAQKPQ
ncbi:MAG TPA: hypothetical protein VMH04_24030 [Candidatus Solibacter sp.]|nr:hypothetical protein [Candidatus Solibacter sp.]